MSNIAKADDRVVVLVRAPGHPSGGFRTTGAHTAPSSPRATAFRKGNPSALGTVQIMIGVFMILVGCVKPMDYDIHFPDLGVISGIYYWGSIIFVVAGSLTVAADNKFNKCLVNGALGMNVVATVTAGISMILYSISAAILHDRSYYYYSDGSRWLTSPLSEAISGVMVIFSLLEFMVSISVSAFACKAICYSEEVVVIGYEMPKDNDVTPQRPQSDYEPLRW